MWKLTELSQHSASGGVGSLRGKFEVAAGPSTPATVSAQFNCEGTTVSGLEFNLIGSGYRVSLVKKRFVSGNKAYFILTLFEFINFVNILIVMIYFYCCYRMCHV